MVTPPFNLANVYRHYTICGRGTTGAASATIVGQCIAMMICLIFLNQRKNVFYYAVFKLGGKTVKKILCTVASSWGLTLSPSIVIMIIL
ncbi:MAG: hypothetical protein RSD88_03170 [Anaerovoracaceae bacterium]